MEPVHSICSLLLSWPENQLSSHRFTTYASQQSIHAYPPSPPQLLTCISLGSAALHDGRWAVLVFDCATARAASLDTLDDAHARRVAGRHRTEDNVALVEPGGHDGGDEKLAAVGVPAGVGHAEHEGLVVRELEVLVGELLAVDGFATRALWSRTISTFDG